MASGEPTQNAPGLHATRQMLDELDALMERMLALPINEAEDIAPTKPAAAKPAAAPLTAKLTLLQVPADDPPLDAAHAGTNPSHLPTLNAARTVDAPRPAPLPPLPPAPAVAPAPLSDRVVPPAADPSADALLAEVPEPDDTFASWFIVPVLWGNRVFDQGTHYLGDAGAWLRTTLGRAVVGTAGLLLLGAAALWLMRDWLGWSW